MDNQSQYGIKAEQIAAFCKALAHPARIQIILFLSKQDECYFGKIHEELPIAKATVSQHLQILKEAGLIRGVIEAPKVRYCIHRENWNFAREVFADFFGRYGKKADGCCEQQHLADERLSVR